MVYKAKMVAAVVVRQADLGKAIDHLQKLDPMNRSLTVTES